jgi:hypothetical protein
MISKNRLGWLARITFAGFLSLGLVACSDDAGDGDPPPDVDAAPEPDAPPPCMGHACPGNDSVVSLPEGGTLRMEYLHAGNNPDGTRIELNMRAFLTQFEGQNSWDPNEPDVPRPFLGPMVASTPSMECYDQRSFDVFFNAYHPNIQEFVDSRDYYADGPATITATSDDPNDPNNIDLILSTDTSDPADGVIHPYIWLGTGPGTDIDRGVKYSVDLQAPNGDYPGLIAETGYDVPANATEWEGSLGAFIAPDFDLTAPTEQEFYNNLQIDPANDLAFGYNLVGGNPIPAEWPTPVWFAGFVRLMDYGDGTGTRPTLEYLCLGPAGRDATNDALAVPAGVFSTDPAVFPQTGKIITGIITHTAWALNETHRFDAVAMNCDIGDFTIAAP